MLINTDAVAALDAANAAIAAVTPRQRRALLVEFYLRDAVRPSRALEPSELPNPLRNQIKSCIALDLLKITKDGKYYLDMRELQSRQSRSQSTIRSLLLSSLLIICMAVLARQCA